MLYHRAVRDVRRGGLRFEEVEMAKPKAIEPSDRMVLNIHTAKFRQYESGNGVVDGNGYLQLDDTFPPGAGFTIYRMAPGSSSQPHEHTCHEQFYVIDGEITDNDGYTYRQGDFVLLKQGTQHYSTTKTGATLAVFVREVEKDL
jgi:quercetin dioxygenase-like cupin family protein